jgi:hypothetical protein
MKRKTKSVISDILLHIGVVPYLALFGVNTLIVEVPYTFTNWLAVIGLYIVARQIMR